MDGRQAAWPQSAASDLEAENRRLTALAESLEARLEKSEKRRRALIHIMNDMQTAARRMNDQRTAMLHFTRGAAGPNGWRSKRCAWIILAARFCIFCKMSIFRTSGWSAAARP